MNTRGASPRLQERRGWPRRAQTSLAMTRSTTMNPVQPSFRLLAVTLEYLLTGRTESLPVLSQALLNCRIVAQLLSTEAGGVAPTRLLLLRSPLLSALR